MFDNDEFDRWMAQASIVKLLKDLENYTLDVHSLTPLARILDRHYVPARYPDAFTEGSPFEFYDKNI